MGSRPDAEEVARVQNRVRHPQCDLILLWQIATQAEEIEGAIDAYERNPNPNYLTIVSNLLNGFSHDNGTSWSWNSYHDDIMWTCLAYLRGYQHTGNPTFRTIAKSNFDMMSARGWDSVFGGGLYWITAKAEKNAAFNGPAAIAAFLLCQTLGDASYLTKAQDIYNWEKAVLFNPINGAVYDNIKTNGFLETWSSTYNQGTFVGAAEFLAPRLLASPSFGPTGRAPKTAGRTSRSTIWPPP